MHKEQTGVRACVCVCERREDESPHIGGCVLGHRGEWGDRWQARTGWNLAACCREKPKISVISLDAGQEMDAVRSHMHTHAHKQTRSIINQRGKVPVMN